MFCEAVKEFSTICLLNNDPGHFGDVFKFDKSVRWDTTGEISSFNKFQRFLIYIYLSLTSKISDFYDGTYSCSSSPARVPKTGEHGHWEIGVSL